MEKIREKRHAAEKKNCKKISKGTCEYLQNLQNPENLDSKDKRKLKCCKEKPNTGGRRKSRRKTRRRKSRRRKSRRRKSRRKYSRSRKR